MTSRKRRFASSALLLCALMLPTSSATSAQGTRSMPNPLATNGAPTHVASTVVAPVDQLAASSNFPAEVRVRRLHLVRPDLLIYPIDYQIIC
jgi:hypothetical protein